MLILEFKKWLQSENLSNGTITNYMRHVSQFLNYCTERKINPNETDEENVREYMVYLAQRPKENLADTTTTLASSTLAKHYDALKRFAKFLIYKKLINQNFMKDIPRPIPRYKVIEGLSNEQLQSLLEAVLKVRSSALSRERTILLAFLIASTGLRISEAILLTPMNFYFANRVIKVLGKGDKEREVPFGFEVSTLVQNWIEKQNIGRNEYIFQSRNGKPITAAGFRDTLRRAKRYLGTTYEIDRMKVHPHVLRHTFAKFWVVKNGNTIALSKILGHTTTQMTDKYVRMWGTDVVRAYDSCAPMQGISVPL